jgi:putative glutamine amidotransferase
VQHIHSQVNHEAGSKVEIAHQVLLDPDSLLGREIAQGAHSIPVNSSHHQSAEVVGDGLKIAARCPEDQIIEAVEGTQPGHYVVAVQWHPERGFERDPSSQNLFRSFIQAAREWLLTQR